MKKFILIFVICPLLLTSCKTKNDSKNIEKQKESQVKVWDGKNLIFWQKRYPLSITWFKGEPESWVPYKAFDDANELKGIVNLLDNPEVNEPLPNLKSRNKLSIIYYNGDPNYLNIVEVYFNLENNVFIGPKGKSKKLGDILVSKEESGLAKYRFMSQPFDENGVERFGKSQDFLREQVKIKSQKNRDSNN
jgi:hypothetical protein